MTKTLKKIEFVSQPTAEIIAKTAGVGAYANCSIDELTVGLARQSSDKSTLEKFKDPHKLIRFCAKKAHWSVFETTNIVIQFKNVPLYVVMQLLRHRANFQQFSQRYSTAIETVYRIEMRKKGGTNRQGSLNELVDNHKELELETEALQNAAFELYQKMLDSGVAPECARTL